MSEIHLRFSKVLPKIWPWFTPNSKVCTTELQGLPTDLFHLSNIYDQYHRVPCGTITGILDYHWVPSGIIGNHSVTLGTFWFHWVRFEICQEANHDYVDYVCLCMAMYDYVRLCMIIYNYLWLCLNMYDFVWLDMTMYDYEWPSMTIYDYAWLCLTMYEYVWQSMRERKRAILKTFAKLS